MKKTIVIISSLAVIVLSAVGIYYILQNNNNNAIPIEMSSSAPTPTPSESSSSSEVYIPPIKISSDVATGGNGSSQSDKKPEEEKIVTEKDGKTEIETIPSYSSAKPEPPPPPKAEGSTSDPNSKPTYKPDDTIKTPSASSEPKYGTKNDKGEIYMGKDWGWVMPSKTETIVVEVNPNGNIIGH